MVICYKPSSSLAERWVCSLSTALWPNAFSCMRLPWSAMGLCLSVPPWLGRQSATECCRRSALCLMLACSTSLQCSTLLIFMYSCTDVLMYSCTVFIYSCIHVFVYSCAHVFMYSCIHVFMYSCTHVLMYSCIHAYMPLAGPACICQAWQLACNRLSCCVATSASPTISYLNVCLQHAIFLQLGVPHSRGPSSTCYLAQPPSC